MQAVNLTQIRREYGALSLDEQTLLPCPIEQVRLWLETAVKEEPYDPTAMVLATVDKDTKPDTRVVLLKDIKPAGFVFFTHFLSAKGEQIKNKRAVALNLYWPILARQIRIRGTAKKVSAQESDLYFSSRPYLSQISACASAQSQVIQDRKILEQKVQELQQKYPEGQVKRPKDWGGYLVTPNQIEFWQGRDNRLHDRIMYVRQNNKWKAQRLAP